MAFSEAWQLKGIFAFAHPTDFSKCQAPLQFHRNTIKWPCVGPGDTAAIVPSRQWQHAHNMPQLCTGLQLSSTAQSSKARRGGRERKGGMH